ncbi:unannotated protein [freshwater metagenome]|uniref:Unannotated protein n=1 Tax=freshwater metagenome TaxID=449393 RepID=A0A6J7GHJ8_9ZZZZ
MTADGSAPRDPRGARPVPARGDLIGGHRIERPLGAGAMGTVWLAEHVTLGRRVALKILADGLAHDESFQERFTREARLAARLDHPNVVTVYDAGSDPAGLWLSMRYVEGEDLRKRLNRVAAATGRAPSGPDASAAGPPTLSPSPFRRPSPADADPTVALPSTRTGDAAPGGLPPEEAVRIVEGVAAGLDHAHSRGILHRDVKPGNVLLETEGDVVPSPAPPASGEAPRTGGPALPPFSGVLLADFGLTKELEDASGELTQTGMLLGSADSVAPEQIEGRDVDARVDVYALGSLLYVALTGAPPFRGATMAKLFAHVNGDRPRAGAAFPELRPFDAVLAAGMAKDPDARPATAGELAAMARDALDRLDVDPQRTVAFPAPTPPRDRRPAPKPRPTPPVPGVPLAPRMREEPTPTEPRTRVAPVARPREEPTPTEPRTRVAPVRTPAAASSGAGSGPPDGPDGPSRHGGGTPPWLVPVLVVGGLLLALVVVLALALGGGDGGDSRTTEADGASTRTTSSTERTDEEPPTETSAADAPATTEAPPSTTEGAPPAQDAVEVEGGGSIAGGAATRDSAAGQPLAGSGTPADYVAADGGWRTLVNRPGDGWEAPTRSMQGGGTLERLRQSGPDGRLILVDHTPSQAASFDTSDVLETRTITGTRFGDRPAYRFRDGRIGSIPECSRLQCVDAPLNQGDRGPGWGVLVAAPTAAEAWATAERVIRATGP